MKRNGSRVLALVAGLCAGSATHAQTPSNCQDWDGSTLTPSTSADVIVGELPSVARYGPVGDRYAYAVGTTSCNIGNVPLEWIDESNNNRHPVIAQNLYRIDVNTGRIEQLGQTWLKHAFFALNQDLCCDCTGGGGGGQFLNPGCADPYGAGLNGDQGGMGPRSEVNANSGFFNGNETALSVSNALTGRASASTTELDMSNAVFLVEGHYIAPDDAEAGNDYNNASYRRVTVDGSYNLNTTGPTVRMLPAIEGWQRHGLGPNTADPDVSLITVDDPDGGRFWVGQKTINLGGGSYRYEYAVFNLNSNRAAGSLTIPIPAGAAVSNTFFRDVDYDDEPYDNTDWNINVSASDVSFSSPQTHAQNPNSNALRWSTMYSFSFVTNSGPQPGVATLGLFEGGGNLALALDVPGGAVSDNDDCNTPFVIGNGTFPFDTTSATTDGSSDALCALVNNGTFENDIWYTYTAGCDGDVTFSTCDNADFDTVIALYAAGACPATDSALFCNDDGTGCGGFTSELTATLTNGTSYLVRVGEYVGPTGTPAGGTGTLTVTGPTCGPDPTGACCNGGSCTTETEADCVSQGGAYIGDDVECQTGGSLGIGPNAGQTTTSTVTISGSGLGSITDVNVSIDVSHTWVQDLDIFITHEGSGITRQLIDQPCFGEDDILCSFSDGSPGFNCPTRNNGLTFAPDQTLSPFNGLSADSDWTLSITDNFDADGGVLNAWSLEINGTSFNGIANVCDDLPPPPPANDDCENPVGIQASGSTLPLDTTSATPDGPADDGCGPTGVDVWYAIGSQPSDGAVTFSTTADYPTIITVYSAAVAGCDDATLAGLFLGCADGDVGLTLDLQSGGATLIRVSAAQGSGGGSLVVNTSFVAAPVGACCAGDGSCIEQSDLDCAVSGGTFQGGGTTCGSCAPPPEIELRLVEANGTGIGANNEGPLTVSDPSGGIELYVQARVNNDSDATGITAFDGNLSDDGSGAFGKGALTADEVDIPTTGPDPLGRTGMFPTYRATIQNDNDNQGNGFLGGGFFNYLPLDLSQAGNGQGINGMWSNVYKLVWSTGDPTERTVVVSAGGTAGGYQTATGLQEPIPIVGDTISLTIAPAGCPCDYNGDLGVDINDLLGFLADWFPESAGSGTLNADFDNDLDVDINDLLGFLSCWFSATGGVPCP